jgi:serine/threonine protein kinase
MSDRTGQKLGNYYIQRSIGHGGFGDVYLGQHVYLNTYAAIKVLQAQLGQTEMQPFLAEARTIAGLSHPNIVRVLEFGVESQTPFLVMDYSPNGTLRQRHPKGSRITLHESVRYLTQVAGALQYAHENKVIHRDIKPENMLVGQTGQILLSDFGIAIVSQSSRYQGQQHVGGTIAYMAPEQLQGKATYTSDQYSLGIVFYEWLTGEVPYKGSFAEIGSQHLFTPPPALHGNVPNITPAVEQVLQKALAKDPQQRFGRVQDFVQALEMASQGNDPTYVIQKSVVVPDQAQVPTFVPPVPNSNVSASGMSTLQQNMPPPPPSLAGAAYPQSMPTPTPLAGTSFQQNTPVLSSQSEN